MTDEALEAARAGSVPLPEEVLERMAAAMFHRERNYHPMYHEEVWREHPDEDRSWEDKDGYSGFEHGRNYYRAAAQACWDASPGPALYRVEAENGRLR